MSKYDNGREVTTGFYEKWVGGMQKEAQYSVESYVRYRLRENGIVRSPLLPPLEITPGMLDKDDDPKILKKYMEIEPNSEATSVPFRGQARRKFVKGAFVPVFFTKIESTEHVVNLAELANYSTDLRKILDEQDVKEIQRQEDEAFMGEIDVIAANNPAEQDIQLFGGMTKNNWASAQQAFYTERPLEYALMNVRTYKEFYKWNYVEDMGFGQHGADVFSKGIVSNPNGVKIIQTIKVGMVPDGVVYFFAPADFIGKFFTYQEPTTFVKQEKDWLYFQTYEIIGIGIGNVRCFIKATFNP